MGLFGSDSTVVALIDIGSSSIGGGYASIAKDGTPHLHYTTRVPIQIHERGFVALDMLRALDVLRKKLIEEGSPILRKAVGSGKVDRVVASIGSPWQETKIRSTVIEKGKSFTFTKPLLASALQEGAEVGEGRISSGELVIAALLNGYETRHPFGKQAERAELVVLSSTLETTMAESVREALQHLYHTRDIQVTAAAPVFYTVLRDLYPHEKDFMVVHVSGEATDLGLVKRGILVDVASVSNGLNALTRAARKGRPLSMTPEGDPVATPAVEKTDSARADWLKSLGEALREFSSRRALPRTVFLLADEEVRDNLINILNDQTLHSLWLSDEPLTVIPSIPQHLSTYVTCDEGCEKDLFLSLLALSIGREKGIPTV